MTFGKRFLQALAAVALGVVISAPAIGQVNTRVVTAGGAATTASIVPGGTVSLDVRLDVVALGVGCFGGPPCVAGATGLIGTAFRIDQSVPIANGFFSITGRSFVGSPFNDTTSGTPDATVLAPPSNLLDPSNNDNLGRSTIGLAPVVPPTNNTLAVNLTLTASPTTPPGTYTINPLAGVSFATDNALNDYAMGSTFTIVVGQTLTVTTSGTGAGTVTSSPGLINCTTPSAGVCSDVFPGTAVTLTPTPAAGSTFIGWSGACAGAGACVVTVDAAKTVNAQFDLGPQTLTVTVSGLGAGTVTSAPAGINCTTGVCTAMFPAGTPVTLTATPNAGSTFGPWSGGTPPCSGSGTCAVVMNGPQSVTAPFLLPTFPLTVTKAGNAAATGLVTSAPAGINCGAACSAPFQSTSVVVLTATPGAGGAVFTGWTGVPPVACPGTGTCSVTILAAQGVTATFADTVVPVTTLTGSPTNPSSDPNPIFTFTSNEPGTFLCTLDGSAPIACASPRQISVGNGPHTFTVQAVDTAGNQGNIVSYPWTAQGIVINNVPIPTLNEWMLVLLAMVLGSAGILARRRRN